MSRVAKLSLQDDSLSDWIVDEHGNRIATKVAMACHFLGHPATEALKAQHGAFHFGEAIEFKPGLFDFNFHGFCRFGLFRRLRKRTSEEMVSKWFWKQMCETMGHGFASQVRQDNLEVSAEVPQKLAACAARSRQFLRVGDNHDPDEGICSFRQRLEQGYAFRANR
jgi:hypothetical protein